MSVDAAEWQLEDDRRSGLWHPPTAINDGVSTLHSYPSAEERYGLLGQVSVSMTDLPIVQTRRLRHHHDRISVKFRLSLFRQSAVADE